MYTVNVVIISAIVAFAVGILLGIALNSWLGSGSRNKRKVDQELHELKSQQRDHQYEVNEHFMETAKLLNKLAVSYRDVHNHLAKGAQTLSADSPAASKIRQLPETDTVIENEPAAPATQPLDYAPRTSPIEKGTLAEEFGFEQKPESSNHDKIAGISSKK